MGVYTDTPPETHCILVHTTCLTGRVHSGTCAQTSPRQPPQRVLGRYWALLRRLIRALRCACLPLAGSLAGPAVVLRGSARYGALPGLGSDMERCGALAQHAIHLTRGSCVGVCLAARGVRASRATINVSTCVWQGATCCQQLHAHSMHSRIPFINRFMNTGEGTYQTKYGI